MDQILYWAEARNLSISAVHVKGSSTVAFFLSGKPIFQDKWELNQEVNLHSLPEIDLFVDRTMRKVKHLCSIVQESGCCSIDVLAQDWNVNLTYTFLSQVRMSRVLQ